MLAKFLKCTYSCRKCLKIHSWSVSFYFLMFFYLLNNPYIFPNTLLGFTAIVKIFMLLIFSTLYNPFSLRPYCAQKSSDRSNLLNTFDTNKTRKIISPNIFSFRLHEASQINTKKRCCQCQLNFDKENTFVFYFYTIDFFKIICNEHENIN